MISLRHRLFALVLAATGTIWICAIVWISIGSHRELERVLDTRLEEAARMVHSLMARGDISTAGALPALEEVGYTRQISCQIWSFDGRLVARSSGAPEQSYALEQGGFADRKAGGRLWRVYTVADPERRMRIAVAERIDLRTGLLHDLLGGLVWPALLIVPLLGGLIWWSLGRGLRPLKEIAGQIAARDGDDMRQVAAGGAPREIAPLVTALDGLFGKVARARQHERDITAFAAHELRTPLAGLKVQAQVALAAKEQAVREQALRQIVISVDRTTRLASQLLALARLEANPEPDTAEPLVAGAILHEVAHSCPTPVKIAVEIDPTLEQTMLRGRVETLLLVLRNLHENAVHHARSRVAWRALPGGDGLAVEDDGPGIAEDERPLVTQRFYRGRHRTVSGSGLGLTIAEMAAQRMGAVLELSERASAAGLRAAVRWPRART